MFFSKPQFLVYQQVVFPIEEDKLLSLDCFDNEDSELSKMFCGSDCCSSHNFVSRWNSLQICNTTSTPDSVALACNSTLVGQEIEDQSVATNSRGKGRNVKGTRRKTKSNISTMFRNTKSNGKEEFWLGSGTVIKDCLKILFPLAAKVGPRHLERWSKKCAISCNIRFW